MTRGDWSRLAPVTPAIHHALHALVPRDLTRQPLAAFALPAPGGTRLHGPGPLDPVPDPQRPTVNAEIED